MAPLEHIHHMTHALRLARQGLGRVWPNPAVGCVLVRNGTVIGFGRTEDGGRPHAERVAIAMAGHEAQGCIAYVTLEPCAHERADGNCTQALIAAGVREVHVACLDPDPRTAGRGVLALQEAGLKVHVGLCEAEAQEVNCGFFLRFSEARPFITLKIASSLDGKVAARDGSSQWITGEQARAYGHGLRARHDAILVGAGTALGDDPLLTTRVPGLGHKAVRVLLDTHLRIDSGSNLVQSAADDPLWIICESDKDNKKQALEALGCILVPCETKEVSSVVQILAERGITRLLVEGGPGIWASFIKAGLYDEITWFRGGKILGGEGRGVLGDMGIESIESALMLARRESLALGPDMLDIFRKRG